MSDRLSTSKILLEQIAHARSGDKGSHANIGVIAWTDEGFEYLERELSAASVADYFAWLKPSRVVRYPLPGIRAFNFLLFDALDGGASQSPRSDSQGKTLANALLAMPISTPPNVEAMKRP